MWALGIRIGNRIHHHPDSRPPPPPPHWHVIRTQVVLRSHFEKAALGITPSPEVPEPYLSVILHYRFFSPMYLLTTHLNHKALKKRKYHLLILRLPCKQCRAQGSTRRAQEMLWI